MLAMKQFIKDEIVGLKWTPTWRQLGDPLTKHMAATLLELFKSDGRLCLIQTYPDH